MSNLGLSRMNLDLNKRGDCGSGCECVCDASCSTDVLMAAVTAAQVDVAIPSQSPSPSPTCVELFDFFPFFGAGCCFVM